ncbi:MAG: hypothetical protein L6Q54_12240 [Leptospiraceae bacterium]|nr:hypothetical protein [Leptospiraceae bacterium]MCK6382001.1 hypothetical protein [Leptospiraceae bacterium]NUM40372.1 hypothetical protein [Leptospiraceae bacterium]
MKQINHDRFQEEAFFIENDCLGLKKHVNSILVELNEQNKNSPIFKRKFSKKISSKKSQEIVLKEIPFIF